MSPAGMGSPGTHPLVGAYHIPVVGSWKEQSKPTAPAGRFTTETEKLAAPPPVAGIMVKGTTVLFIPDKVAIIEVVPPAIANCVP